MANILPASEKGLYGEPMLTDTLEESGFLDPLDSVNGIEHVGWFSTVEPIFQVDKSVSIQAVAVEIASLVKNGQMESAGLRGFIVPADSSLREVIDIFSETVVIVKIENWWDSCIPNQHLDSQEAIEGYIEESESEMSERLRSCFTTSVIEVDAHSDYSGDFGQYQFVGWNK